MTPRDMNELIKQLEAKHGQGWTIHRTHSGVCVQIAPHCNLDAPTIEEAVKKAVEYNIAPSIVRRPEQLYLDRFSFEKKGNRWVILYDVKDGLKHERGYVKTRKEAERCALSQIAHRNTEIEIWDAAVGELVRNGKEGVDYHWAY